MDLSNITATQVRLTANGFCWQFSGTDPATHHKSTVTVYFDFCWFCRIAADLHRVLHLRDAETGAARTSLTEIR